MLALSEVANPSSVHGAGRHARRLVETARSALAYEIGGRAEDIVFTSGGTEANALAIKGALSLISAPKWVIQRRRKICRQSAVAF